MFAQPHLQDSPKGREIVNCGWPAAARCLFTQMSESFHPISNCWQRELRKQRTKGLLQKKINGGVLLELLMKTYYEDHAINRKGERLYSWIMHRAPWSKFVHSNSFHNSRLPHSNAEDEEIPENSYLPMFCKPTAGRLCLLLDLTYIKKLHLQKEKTRPLGLIWKRCNTLLACIWLHFFKTRYNKISMARTASDLTHSLPALNCTCLAILVSARTVVQVSRVLRCFSVVL